MTAYQERFPVGSHVRVATRERLDDFLRAWHFHHPLSLEQLPFAGRRTLVEEVSFYHGGDALYALEGLPGLWHEQCLESAGDEGAA